MHQFVLLATEGIEGLAPDHIASKLAVPIGIVIFSGAVFALLWSNYGARKGGLVYGTALFGFMGVIGVFWWFGAPGVPVATGLQNFPGQAGDAYQPQWYGFEPDSPRAQFFPATNDLGDFQTLEEFAGTSSESDPAYSALRGDLDSVSSVMLAQYFPTNETGFPLIGASRRTAILENTPEPDPGYMLADPSYTAQVVIEGEGDDEELQAFFATAENGQRLAGAQVEVIANYMVDPDADPAPDGPSTYTTVVEADQTWFAFKDPGALWLPSGVWTLASFALFGLCLFGLDRIEMREKRELVVAEEPEDVEVPIAQ